MPLPLPSRTPSGPRRRSLLASAAGAVLLVGCSSGAEESEESAGDSPSVSEAARARAARESGELVARYDAVLAVHPALAGRLGPLRAEVVRHVEAFGGAAKASPSATGPATGSPTSPTASSTSSAPVPPADPSAVPSAVPITDTDALAGLAAAERALADRRATELPDVPGELARLLASVAAAGAAHAYLLTEGTR
ncbi:hypothetical protein OHU34_12065 [Streptomyces sp. NBC_00080]|uniref:hypothetical protein n=1 Tax=Streptomyces TaxID=1883 RepID=UPI001166D279|nr:MULTISPECIES: hypothetical protein [Streptomyces]TQJ56091.1 hypothetical protein FBY34_3907 [Streptomyces sp. SLBN-115]